MSEIDWEGVAQEAAEGLAKDLGELQRLFEQGRIRRYLFIFEWEHPEGGAILSDRFTPNEHIWAIGAARHTERWLERVWQSIDLETP